MKPSYCEWTFMVCLAISVCQVLGDTEILIKEPGVGDIWAWHSKKIIQQGAGWNAPSTQKPVYGVCDITTRKEPINWLRTDFIDVKNAKLLNVELRYSLFNCPPESSYHCKTNFSLYVFHTNTTETPAPEPYQKTYQKIDTITQHVLPKPGAIKKYTYHATVATKAGGMYLAFLDQGACISLTNVTVSFNYCSEKSSGLVKFPRTLAPVNNSQLVEQTGECKANSVSKVKLSGVCLSSGEWNITDGLECSCVAGYELVNGSESNSLQCNACVRGFYKSTVGNHKCLRCPANSASNAARSGCDCSVGFYKLTEKIAPCKALPLAPLNADTAVIKVTYVAISWTRSPDDINGNHRYSVDCFRCKSGEDKECNKSCGARVQYKPNKDNITDVTVKINGLSSDGFFLFRIYSVNELNQQEKDRNKWKYAEVFVKTKTDGHGQAFQMRWCTISDKDTEKCNAFKSVMPALASATGLSVNFSCVNGTGAVDCMKKIQQGTADLITLDGGEIYMAGKDYSMVPIVGEDYDIGTPTTSYFAVAVAKKNNPGINFTNLKGKKSCHTGAGKTAGWNVPVGLLLSEKIMTTDKSCSSYVAAGNFFSESCVPNVKLAVFGGSNNPNNLCALCPDECSQAGKYSGYSGAFQCLKDGVGEVAFIKHTTVPSAEASNYQYLCKDGSRADSFTNCYLARVPSHAVMTKTGGDNIANFKTILIKASHDYGINQTNPNNFQLFNSTKYGGKDLLFKDSTKKLVDVKDKDTYKKWLGDDYLKDLEALTACPSISTVAPNTSTVAPSTSTVAPSTSTVAPSTSTVATKRPTSGSKNTKLHLFAAMFSFIALLFSGTLLK